MKYADKIIELLAHHPDRDFRMREIIRYINPHPLPKERNAMRVAVSRVLIELVDYGQIIMKSHKSGERGYAMYKWKNLLHDTLESATETATLPHPHMRPR